MLTVSKKKKKGSPMPSTHKQHMHGETENFNSHDNEFISGFLYAVCCIISQLGKPVMKSVPSPLQEFKCMMTTNYRMFWKLK